MTDATPFHLLIDFIDEMTDHSMTNDAHLARKARIAKAHKDIDDAIAHEDYWNWSDKRDREDQPDRP